MAAKTRRSNLDAEIQQLYARPLAEFTAARNDLAKRLQKEGKTDDASEVKSLAKPTASAWAVNRLFQEEKERMDALLAAGARARDALRHTLAHGEAEVLRESLQEERKLRDDLRRRAAGLLGKAGQAILDRVGTNLDALALSPAAADVVERGWLDRDLDPPGFEVLSGLPLSGARPERRGLRLVPQPEPARKPAKAPARDREAEKRTVQEEKRRRQEETAREKEERAAEARREKEEVRLREQLARVQEKAEHASAEELSARRDAERAEKEAAAAEKAAEEAARRAQAAREAAERARQRAERAARELERAEGHVEAARKRLGSD
jgi:hypothetical protein